MADLIEKAYLMSITSPLVPCKGRSVEPLQPVFTPPDRPLILEKLPKELLPPIFLHLSGKSDDVHAVRLCNKTFRDCAWPAFGRTFNHRVFHLTPFSISHLSKLASEPSAACQITKLNISTVAFGSQGLNALETWLKENKTGKKTLKRRKEAALAACSLTWAWQYDEEAGDPDLRCGKVLPVIVGLLRNLSEIIVVNGDDLRIWPRLGFSREVREVLANAQGDQVKLYNRHAHARTIQQAVGLAANNTSLRTQIKTLSLDRRIDLTALCPTCIPDTITNEPTNLFPALTHLTLDLTNPSSPTRPFAPATFIPPFLTGMPALTHLWLTFPPMHENLAPLTTETYFGEAGFLPISALRFSHLSHLHLENLHLYHPDLLEDFLAAHAETLRRLELFQVSFLGPEWRGFVEFLGEKLDLEVLVQWGYETRGLRCLEERWAVPEEVWRKAARRLIG